MRPKLIECRIALGLTQKELGEKVGLSRSAIAKYETVGTDIPASVLQRLAQILHAPLEELLISEDAQPEDIISVGD